MDRRVREDHSHAGRRRARCAMTAWGARGGAAAQVASALGRASFPASSPARDARRATDDGKTISMAALRSGSGHAAAAADRWSACRRRAMWRRVAQLASSRGAHARGAQPGLDAIGRALRMESIGRGGAARSEKGPHDAPSAAVGAIARRKARGGGRRFGGRRSG